VCAVDEGAEIDPELEEGAWNPVSEGKEDAVIAVFINPGAASFFGSKSKSENSRVPEPRASLLGHFLSYRHNFG
jgi:hypothetical protein